MIRHAGKDARSGNTGAIMLLHEQIRQSLAGLKGLESDVPATMEWSVASGASVAIDFTVVDSLSCGFRELRLSADELKNAPFDALKTWAAGLCQKVTYLLEHISPLENDSEAQTVLIRSTPPSKQPDHAAFYEMLIQVPGTLSLRRYTRAAHEADRTACDIQVTQEVLVRLVQDIVAAIPTAPAL